MTAVFCDRTVSTRYILCVLLMSETAELMNSERAREVERLFLQQLRRAEPINLPAGWSYVMHTVAILRYSMDGDSYVHRINFEDLREAATERGNNFKNV